MSTKNTKNVSQQIDNAVDIAAVKAEAQSTARRGPVRRNRKTSEQEKQTNGRTHEENQERAYIAASRRSDRSIEARLESARRASEIHKRRCGRGLKVTEEAVMNEEMYEEEDPDYEQRVSRLRMVMNTPNFPYAAFPTMQQYYPLMMQNQNGATETNNQSSTPGTPVTQNATIDQQHPQHQFLFSPWYNQSTNGMPQQQQQVPQSPMSPMSPGATGTGQYTQAPHSMSNFQSPTQQQPPHFLPPTQFPSQNEPRTAPKSAYPVHAGIPETEVVFDSSPLDLFADVEFDSVDPTDTNSLWNYNGDEQQHNWIN